MEYIKTEKQKAFDEVSLWIKYCTDYKPLTTSSSKCKLAKSCVRRKEVHLDTTLKYIAIVKCNGKGKINNKITYCNRMLYC